MVTINKRTKDLTNMKFGKLTAIKIVPDPNKVRTMWLCQCECGDTIITRASRLLRGETKSCGCMRKEKASRLNLKYKHSTGKYTRIYDIWRLMLRRCYNAANQDYKNYGARGIKVCDCWKNNFDNFADWAIMHGYKNNLTIDRIDVNGNYEPSNCRWATIKQQANNKRTNRIVKYKNKKMTVRQLSESLNIPYETLRWKLNEHKLKDVIEQ